MAKMLKEEARRYLADVPEDYVFRCHDSCIFKNVRELRDGLADMSDEIYTFHANSEKNDFSTWVKAIIKDETLAEDLRNARTKADSVRRVANRITVLSRV
jgi:hypothetical protein